MCHLCPVWQEKFVMTHVLLEYHIIEKKSGGAFQAIPAILMHFNSVMLDSDLEIVEGQKKVVYEPKVKIASMTCKSIVI